ncbi:YppE family protein [Cytobacillus purgationiresistens]|uniref:DUF1798 family protein n=1 Tax=Cytobacillus purgationiresistens TaxID=863449 RepID=A0ABU0AKX6_9BACI|nr:YppE family protein [Cytobacillus purgationiresistens]MDQ0271038.1 hypothetical protein [Cytobacillus purgationiresistens]
MDHLIELTRQMLIYIDDIENRYAQGRESGEKGDFYSEVKPFADKVKEDNDKWLILATEWVNCHHPKNLHSQQIVSAFEQIETLSVQAFFPETSKTRFINQLNSAKYILNVLLSSMEQKKEPQ